MPDVPALMIHFWSLLSLLLPVPTSSPEAAAIERQLGASRWKTRQAACKQLLALGDDGLHLAYRLGTTHPDPEVRMRARACYDELHTRALMRPLTDEPEIDALWYDPRVGSYLCTGRPGNEVQGFLHHLLFDRYYKSLPDDLPIVREWDKYRWATRALCVDLRTAGVPRWGISGLKVWMTSFDRHWLANHPEQTYGTDVALPAPMPGGP